VGEEAEVGGAFVGRGSEGGEGVEEREVELAGVGLAADGKDVLEVEGGGKFLFELEDFVVVIVEEGEEGGLGTGGSFEAEEWEVVEEARPVLGIEEKVLEPEAEALANGGGLGSLEVGVAKAGVRLVLGREAGEELEDMKEFLEEEREGLFELDEVGVVSDVGGGGAEVDDGFGVGAGVAEGVDMGHDVVAEFFFVGVDFVKVDVGGGRLHLGNLFGRDGEAMFVLGFGEGNPEAAECEGAPLEGEEVG